MQLRNLQEYRLLANTIKDQAQQCRVAYFPNPGNWGDGLINAGTLQFLERYKIEYTTFERRELSKAIEDGFEVAVVGGGGGWCRNWGSTPGFLKKVASRFSRVVLLPTSFERGISPTNLSNVRYFSRDRAAGIKNAIYCPDMAFYYDFPKIDPSLNYPLLAFRRDKERNPSAVAPFRNWDLSLLGVAQHEVESLVALVGKFEAVYTDRLHIGITAGMLGRKTYLLEGNYAKNSGVFEATIRPHLENVDFITWKQLIEKSPAGFYESRY